MFKDAFTKDKFLLEHDTPEDFVRSAWQKTPRVLLIWIVYRAILVVYTSGCLIIICANPSPGSVCQKNMIHFTHWAFLSQTVVFAFGCGISLERYLKEKKDPELPPMEKMPVVYKVMWCIYTTAASTSIAVTIMFWALVYNPDDYDTIIYTLLTHAFNTVTMIFDFFLSAIPYRILHVYVPLSFVCIYVIFSLIYQISGGTGNNGQIPIYKVLDWRNPAKSIIICTTALVAVVITHSIYCLFWLLRQFLRKIRNREIQKEPEIEEL